ncbi:MAG: MarR family winged helix-turn-helix transcriptional regulator [Acidimicrobiales bacterium]
MGDPAWLSEREQRAWRGLLAMQAQLNSRLRQSMQRNTGLSDADYGVLVNLSEAPEGRLRIFELAAALQWEKSRLSHQVGRMEQRGLVERHECATDGRGAFVVLTDIGRRSIEAAAPHHVSGVQRYFIEALSPSQLDALSEIAEAVLTKLAGDGPEIGPEGCLAPRHGPAGE